MERDVYLAALSGSVNELQSRDWKDMKTPLGNNVLHVLVGKPLKGKITSKNKSVPFINYVLGATVENSMLLQTNDNGDTPLHLAARFGHADAVEAFLTYQMLQGYGVTSLMNMSNINKDTALHEAARGGHALVVKLLVEAEAEAGPDNSDCHNPNGVDETPLYLAAEKGCVDSFSSILQVPKALGSLPENRRPFGLTVLHIAVLCRNEGVVKKILENGSSLISVKNDQGQTALHCAAAQHVHDLSILQHLLNYDDQYNSAAYIQDNKGRTPLHLAALSWNFKGASKIIQSYPDCIETVDISKQNVVHYAANLGCLHRLQRFLEHAPSCDRLLNDKDQNGDTPLHLVAATTPSIPSHDCFVRLAKFIKQYDYILDVNAYNNQNLTAGDIIASNTSLRHFAAAPPRQMSKILPKSRRRNNGVPSGEIVKENVNNITLEEKNINLRKVEDKISTLKKANETRLVVAALIATVSFTAGFTVPGGFFQNNPDNTKNANSTGLAVLGKHPAFQAFLVSDTVAFTLSSLAIICYFVVAREEAFVTVDNLSISAHLLNSISLGALMIAFVSGVCAVVTNSPVLVATVIIVSLFYFYFYLNLLLGTFGGLLAFMTRNSSKKARE
ncbi:protein ACCELERATED CELL DEATH 6-like [Silene latifolia]|uniref:protein ACCELERATED CELL DEATH 6-like n=1 Tax=Silene latifolia TaxID=37657 RepID=UPI003D76E7A7